MAHHRATHPTPVADCFGCKTLGIGVQAALSAANGKLSKSTTDELGNTVTEHWHDRQDVMLRPQSVELHGSIN